MKAELIESPKEISLESLQAYLAKCSSVVRNTEIKNPAKLWDRLMKESYGDKPSRVFEYIPITITEDAELEEPSVSSDYVQLFGVADQDSGTYYTNMREMLEMGYSAEQLLPYVDFTHYKAVKVTAPYFIYGQISTHTQITSVSHSNRYSQANLGYWMPNEIREYWAVRDYLYGISTDRQAQWNDRVMHSSPAELQQYMKSKGVKRREVWARGSDMLETRVYTLGGYTNTPNGWQHFINQRMRDPHTQAETKELAGLINTVVGV